MASAMSLRLAAGLAVLVPLALRLTESSCFAQAPLVSSDVSRAPRTFHGAARAAGPLQMPAYGTAATSLALSVAAAGAALLARAGARGKKGLTARRANMVATRPDQAIPWWDRMTQPMIEPGVGIWAEKLNMTTIFQEEEGNVRAIPATILCVKRGGNYVTNKYWPEKHGYYAVQVGYERYQPKSWEKSGMRKLKLQELEKNGLPPLRKLKEFRCRPQTWDQYEIGQKIWASDLFQEGDYVDVHGRSKGKGFAGTIKKWGHKRGPMTHGSKHHRRYGSVGAGKPKRVLPDKKMAGWLGDNNHTQWNLKILKVIDRIDEENMPESIIVVEGSVPGYTAHWETGGSYVYLNKHKNKSDGRFMRDPVWLWYYKNEGENSNIFAPIKQKAWTWKSQWGRDIRWITREVSKYWPDGFPGYDHSDDPFYDDCNPTVAFKAPEW
eukprot:gb/GFBE01041704.1/.p1 GENE.gb/GFBE01041704.1/~~gb/GFBE01041704.1/.p1  ORF type:complete len:437 (+),score=107.09 gb/GFBE01041704.1/:1-1311(+)